MNMEKSAERTYGLPIAVIAACAMLLISFSAQAFATSHLGLTGSDAAGLGASGLPSPESDGNRIAAGLEVAVQPAPAEQPAPSPPSEIGPGTPSSNESGARISAWMTVDRILLSLAFLVGIVIVGFVAVRLIRNKRKPDAH